MKLGQRALAGLTQKSICIVVLALSGCMATGAVSSANRSIKNAACIQDFRDLALVEARLADPEVHILFRNRSSEEYFVGTIKIDLSRQVSTTGSIVPIKEGHLDGEFIQVVRNIPAEADFAAILAELRAHNAAPLLLEFQGVDRVGTAKRGSRYSSPRYYLAPNGVDKPGVPFHISTNSNADCQTATLSDAIAATFFIVTIPLDVITFPLQAPFYKPNM